MKPRICPISGKSLEGFHGNRKHHPDAFFDYKKQKNKGRYDKLKEMDKLALRLDRILEANFPLSKGKTGVDKNYLQTFAWDFMTKITNSSPPIFWILDYGYSYIDDKKKIIIYYGADQL